MIYYDWFLGNIEMPSFEELKEIGKEKYSNTRYECTGDLQGGDFAVGTIQTAYEWFVNALEWCDSDENYALMNSMYKTCENDKELIDFIQECWDIELIKIQK